jgi:hypothetical protein
MYTRYELLVIALWPFNLVHVQLVYLVSAHSQSPEHLVV